MADLTITIALEDTYKVSKGTLRKKSMSVQGDSCDKAQVTCLDCYLRFSFS